MAQLVKCLKPVFLKLDYVEPLGSTKGCQGFQEMKKRNGGRVLLAVLHLYVRIKILVVTFNTNHSLTESMQTINHCFNSKAS